ncbi:DUF2313 domain-containing protein [Ignatzschineria rhizosphaerae]|uniref:DUF2313 domain-containing protein n=1 Tax=Ignatzschineria rhizosphaerae TaxID=2923279 RepID=A0ABY3X6N0_9GAMM|nr:putative phage tail protein [Ignatzschineria rhizosphaerae]UNM95658.1 DUF2313 domain-containing protein [Ignatzschineria rhizosphaerae]
MSEKDYQDAGLKLLPNGLAWSKKLTGTFSKLFAGIGSTFAQIDAEANQAINETNPAWANVMLPEWEELLALPECGQTGQTLAERQKAAGYKWHLKGSLNYKFYEDWIKGAFGYDIEIVTRHPHHCMRPCNYPLYSDEYKSRAEVYIRISSDSPYRYFNVQDRVNDPLVIGQPSIVECILNKYKPAHMEFIYHYEKKES